MPSSWSPFSRCALSYREPLQLHRQLLPPSEINNNISKEILFYYSKMASGDERLYVILFKKKKKDEPTNKIAAMKRLRSHREKWQMAAMSFKILFTH